MKNFETKKRGKKRKKNFFLQKMKQTFITNFPRLKEAIYDESYLFNQITKLIYKIITK